MFLGGIGLFVNQCFVYIIEIIGHRNIVSAFDLVATTCGQMWIVTHKLKLTWRHFQNESASGIAIPLLMQPACVSLTDGSDSH